MHQHRISETRAMRRQVARAGSTPYQRCGPMTERVLETCWRVPRPFQNRRQSQTSDDAAAACCGSRWLSTPCPQHDAARDVSGDGCITRKGKSLMTGGVLACVDVLGRRKYLTTKPSRPEVGKIKARSLDAAFVFTALVHNVYHTGHLPKTL
jgi:hypothetical protein